MNLNKVKLPEQTNIEGVDFGGIFGIWTDLIIAEELIDSLWFKEDFRYEKLNNEQKKQLENFIIKIINIFNFVEENKNWNEWIQWISEINLSDFLSENKIQILDDFINEDIKLLKEIIKKIIIFIFEEENKNLYNEIVIKLKLD